MTIRPTLAKVFGDRRTEPPTPEALAVAGSRLVDAGSADSPLQAAQLLKRVEPRATVEESDLALAIVQELTKRPSRPGPRKGEAALRSAVWLGRDLVLEGKAPTAQAAAEMVLSGAWGQSKIGEYESTSGETVDTATLACYIAQALAMRIEAHG